MEMDLGLTKTRVCDVCINYPVACSSMWSLQHKLLTYDKLLLNDCLESFFIMSDDVIAQNLTLVSVAVGEHVAADKRHKNVSGALCRGQAFVVVSQATRV